MSLRILLVLETSGGGSGRHVLDLADGLKRAGHHVHVVYSARRAEAQFVEALDGIEVEQTAIDMRRAPHPADISAAHALSRYIRRHGPFDIVHGHSSKGGALSRLAALGCKSATVYTPHCLRTLEPTLGWMPRAIYGTAERVLAGITDAVIAVSKDEYDHARQLGIPERKLRIVVNGVPVPKTLPRRKTRDQIGLQVDDIVIGFIGRLVHQKAPERLIQSFARLVPDNPHAKLVIVGDGPLEAALKERANELEIAPRITWLPGTAGPATMAAFDIFAMPSLYEGMPYVLLEAMAAGLPIVATDVGGVRTVVTHDTNGFIVPNWSPDTFVDSLRNLVADAKLRNRMGRASKSVASQFSVEKMVAETVSVYASILEPR